VTAQRFQIWSHHRPHACADEYWAFAHEEHVADRGRVTALTHQVTGAFGRIPRHSEAICVSQSREAPRECAPNGNHMATICAPTRVIPGVQGTRVGGVPDEHDSRASLDQKTIKRLKERARLNGRSLQRELKDLLERAAGTLTIGEARRLSDRWRRRLGARPFSDSARLVRSDRDAR
jgi:hypothetical protein